ncbi:MAG TPA: zinc ribbon domain-containing protein [Pyrinomonadaceae bacterium]|nr:zinc ribbon domain-containing protein [Pyrinomonadaceae bacterium]
MSDPTLMAMTCPHCGIPAAPGEGFCRSCGKQLFAPTITAPPPAVPPLQQASFAPPAKKRRSKLMMGCLVFIGLVVVAAGAGGIYIWRRTSYTPPVRKAPAIPERAAGTMTEFPVDNDKEAPAKPTSVQTETLSGAAAKAGGSSPTKLPPGIDRPSLAKGATTMTSATYRPRPKNPGTQSNASVGKDIYICVLTAMPNEPGFVDGLAASVARATSGARTGVRVQSPKGGIYTGSRIRSPQANVYVLSKQGADVVILIYGTDPSTQDVVDRLAQNVGNGEGLNDYPEVKDSLWTLPASTPSDLTLLEINTLTGEQIESSIGSGGDLPSQMRPFIPERLTSARYTDTGRQEWVALNLEYGSTFQAWRTWLLARSALGLGGAQTTTVRDVDALYLNQEGKRILIFQKGPYLIFLSGPGAATVDRLVALGNQIQV